MEGLDAVVHLAGQGLPIEDGPRPQVSSGTVEWNRPPIFDPLLKNATLRPRGSSVLPPLAGTATGTTTSLTNHLHQAMDSWRTSARLESAAQSNTMASACLRFGLVLDRSGGTEKMLPLFDLDSVVLWAPDATGKLDWSR